MKKKWYQQKTSWTGIGGIVGGVASIITGAVAWPVALPGIITSIGLIFLRQGVENTKQ